jgi:hypothetical protein
VQRLAHGFIIRQNLLLASRFARVVHPKLFYKRQLHNFRQTFAKRQRRDIFVVCRTKIKPSSVRSDISLSRFPPMPLLRSFGGLKLSDYKDAIPTGLLRLAPFIRHLPSSIFYLRFPYYHFSQCTYSRLNRVRGSFSSPRWPMEMPAMGMTDAGN